jgi:putative transposase
MPKAFPEEFRRDVVAVARRKEAPMSQIAKDFGISESCLHRWVHRAEIEDGVREGLTLAEQAEIRELKKRNRLLEQENEVLRRAAIYLGQASTQNDVPAGPRACRRRDPRHGDLPGARVLATGLLQVESEPGLRPGMVRRPPGRSGPGHPRRRSGVRLPLHHRRAVRGARDRSERERVHRLCTAHGIFSVLARRKGRRPRPGEPVHDDRVRRAFTSEGPNELWFTDLTEHPTAEGKLYLCCVKDAFSGRIVGYSMDSRMKASLAVAALRNAVELRRPSGTVVHSDRGSQFRSGRFVRLLRNTGLIGSMGRTGACADNAAMESFFALLQRNVLDRRHWQTREELRLAVVTWIERTYHRRRRQRALGKFTPIEFEALHEVAHAA